MNSDPQFEQVEVEIVDDHSAERGSQDGFLKVSRLTVRNRYADGSRSEPYPCDIVSRAQVDAVTVVIFQRRDDGILVGLRESLRVPIYMRRHKDSLPFPDDPPQGLILETVAGLIEPEDARRELHAALRHRAALECHEEVGLEVDADDILELGSASFPSPGVADEMVYFCAAEVPDLAAAKPPAGDGSTMEEHGRLVTLPLHEAIERCRSGSIPDMKTEIALTRLRDLSESLARTQKFTYEP